MTCAIRARITAATSDGSHAVTDCQQRVDGLGNSGKAEQLKCADDEKEKDEPKDERSDPSFNRISGSLLRALGAGNALVQLDALEDRCDHAGDDGGDDPTDQQHDNCANQTGKRRSDVLAQAC